MDIQSEVEGERFLSVLCTPFKSMCKLITLKSGVIIIAIADIIIGILNFIEAVMYLIWMLNGGWAYFYLYLHLTMLFTRVSAVPFAFFGIRGMTKITPDDVSIYSKFKIYEYFILTFCITVEAIYIGMGNGNAFVAGLFAFAIRLLFVLFVVVVWSADIRLRYNETVLVMHGEGALKLMQQQAANLATPKVITPGMPIYFYPPPNNA